MLDSTGFPESVLWSYLSSLMTTGPLCWRMTMKGKLKNSYTVETETWVYWGVETIGRWKRENFRTCLGFLCHGLSTPITGALQLPEPVSVHTARESAVWGTGVCWAAKWGPEFTPLPCCEVALQWTIFAWSSLWGWVTTGRSAARPGHPPWGGSSNPSLQGHSQPAVLPGCGSPALFLQAQSFLL